MDEQLASLLEATQSPVAGTRQQAEANLQQLYANDALPLSLVSVASHDSVNLPIRQSALIVLKNYVLATWSPEFEEFKSAAPISDETKARVRSSLLELSTSEAGVDSKIRSGASNVVSKIASADYPDQWQDLLPTLLGILGSNPSDARLHGTLKALFELIADGLDEGQFFPIAQDLVNSLYAVAANDQRKAKLRALAVSIFKECFNTLQVVMEDHKAEVKAFVDQSLTAWLDLILGIINIQLGNHPEGDEGSEGGPLDTYRGLVALKIQVARVLITIRTQFPSVLSPRSPALFSAVYDGLTRLLPGYQARYIEDDVEGRLEDADGLPYTVDFLVLEELDFLQGCLRAPPVRKELERQLEADPGSTNWLSGFIKLIIAYAQITVEEQGMWELDVNVFLAEETSVTANYTARTACGDLVIKLGEWLRERMLFGLAHQTEELFSRSDEGAWRQQEAAMFMLDQTLSDWEDYDRKVSGQLIDSFLVLAQRAQQHQSNPFLRARSYTVIGNLMRCSSDAQRAPELMQRNLQGIHGDSAELVQVSCVRAIPNYLRVLPPQATLPLQTPIIQALSHWLSTKQISDLSESDELLFVLVESLRDVITLDTRVCLTGDALSVLFSVVSNGADNFQITNLVSETFEEICSTIKPLGAEAYTQLCQKVLPSITGAFDVGKMTEENALSSLAAELLAALTAHASQPLPQGFVAAVMPKLSLLLLNSTDDELLKECTTALKNILTHDAQQLLDYIQPAGATEPKGSSTPTQAGKPGLETVLQVVDRLLSPALASENASAEVGSLAAALIEHVGSQQLGSYLMPLLTAVATRIATAEKVALVQSLVMVFARLAVHHSANEVIDFLASVNVPDPSNASNQQSGVDVVMRVWLNDATPTLAGYQDIRLNVIALTKLYELQDPRLNGIMCKGEMIVNPETSGRIMTRSRAKAAPQAEQWTQVSVPVKIIKLLIDELANAPSSMAMAGVGTPGLKGGDAAESEGSEDDSDWEDDLGADELLKFANEEPGGAGKQVDSETLQFLENWFKNVGGQDGFMEGVFDQLSAEEQETLRRL